MKSINDYVNVRIAEARTRKKTDEPVPDDDITITDGKRVKVDVSKLKGKPESANKGCFAIDPPTDDDAIRWDGVPRPENVEELLDRISGDRDFFVIGHAGWAKTSIIKKAAHKYGKTVITVSLDNIPAEDMGGIPVPVEKGGRHEQVVLLPTWAQYMYDAMMDENDHTEFLLFFDEMNQAPGEVLNTLMRIVLEKQICGIQFDNFMVGGAGNYADENDCVHDLPKPLMKRMSLIAWKDKDKESWEDWMDDYMRKTWENEFDGKASELLDVIEKYMEAFDNPRDIELEIFKDIRNKINNAIKRGKPLTKEDVSLRVLKGKITTLLADAKTLDELKAKKEEVLSDFNRAKAVDEIAGKMYEILTNSAGENTKKGTQNLGKKAVMMSNEQLNKALRVAQEGHIYWPVDGNGRKTSSSDTIIVSRDNLMDIYEITKQQQDQIETAMGDIDGADGYAWQTEKDAKKKNSSWLTYAEACKKYPELI